MIAGKVIPGEGVGKRQGYQTANLDVSAARAGLPKGVYAGRAWLRGHLYLAAIVVGAKENKVEVNLLDYAGPDFYGEELRAEAVQKVSELFQSDSLAELKAKIDGDMRMINAVFAAQSEPYS